MTRRRTALLAAVLALAPAPARAWDPSTTHLGMLDRALVESALHLRWMAASELQRGLFTPLRVDPARLTPAERHMLTEALRRGGVQALGGPGACPGQGAPPETQRYCVEGDLWELSAVQWLQLGVLAELVPSARAVHHFVDREDPLRPDFRDPQPYPALLRSRQVRHNGAPTATLATRTGFAGNGPSVVAWLRDAEDPLAPPRMWQHLERASTLADPLARSHHLALALVGLGALVHVAQDLGVPAHARGDVAGFFNPLSRTPGDRGLPFTELARLDFGRFDLPGARTDDAVAQTRGIAVAGSLAEHLFGGAAASSARGALVLPPGTGHEGIAVFTARRFLSESSVPEPRFLEPTASPEDAAAALLAGAALDPAEVQGARLHPWPATRGYIQSATGRPLAAFDTDDEGRIRPYIDEAVYREQFAHLVPRAVETTRSLIDWVWPTWPELHYDVARGTLDLPVPEGLSDAVALVMRQDAAGKRTITHKVALRPGERNRVPNLPTTLGEGERTVVVLRARRPSGEPLLLEQTLAGESKVFPIVPAPYVPPPPPEPEPEESLVSPVEAPFEEPSAEEEASEAVEPVAAPPATSQPGSGAAGKSTGTGQPANKGATGGTTPANPPKGPATSPSGGTTGGPTNGSSAPPKGTNPSSANTTPPPKGPATNPSSGNASPPSGSAANPPSGSNTTPPKGSATNPSSGTTTAPPKGSATNPSSGTTTAPPSGTTTPPKGAATNPSSGNTTSPPSGAPPRR